MVKFIRDLARKRPVIFGAALGILFGILLIVAVIAGGMTFGQRCGRVFEYRSQQWQQCVDKLANGEIKNPGEINAEDNGK